MTPAEERELWEWVRRLELAVHDIDRRQRATFAERMFDYCDSRREALVRARLAFLASVADEAGAGLVELARRMRRRL